LNPDSLVIGSEGYLISYAIAKENLALGLDVIVDSVKDVLNRDYEPWESISMLVDTSIHSVDTSVQKIIEYIKLEA
jgi:hypothetical protein